MDVAGVVGSTIVACGVDRVFGVIGSGNFHVTNAMITAGAQFVAARHEHGAATMADAYARMARRPSVVSVHQGCGLTNAMTGITEAAKSRTPVVVIAAEVLQPRSNFYVDQAALATAVGAVPLRITSAATAGEEAAEAVRTAVQRRRTVLLNLPLQLQAEPASTGSRPVEADEPRPVPGSTSPSVGDLERLAAALERARRPVFIAGRGARVPGSRSELEALAERHGALLATSAVAKGLFNGSPWSLDVSGGFASPTAAELIGAADLIVGWGCTLNMWTMRHGRLIGPDTTVAQVDDDPAALGAHRDITVGVVGDVRATARALVGSAPTAGSGSIGYRSDAVRERIARSVRWRDVSYDDSSTPERIDPRTLTISIDDLLPAERIVSVDSGNFMGYPSMFLGVPDEDGFCFTQAFQAVGLGLATAIGAALARPDRLPVAAVGDGGLMMAAAELDTVTRLGLPMVVVVYNDSAYGAEVHHFGPDGFDLRTVTFPETDIAAVARGHGFTAVTVRGSGDLRGVRDWLDGPRVTPLLVDAKVTSDRGAWWLEEAFRGH
jgi:thiamine pyrophosphate-dependent acetolactate synthase large subunit-like protein